MILKYCPECGGLLTKKEIGDEGLVPFCTACNRPFFNVSYPCVILAVINEKNEVCVIKQSYGRDMFVLVAGFVKFSENVEMTIKEEVKEEIGQEVIDFAYVKSYFQASRENLMLGFLARVKETKLILSSELKEASFVCIDEAIKRLQNANIALDLLLEIKNRGLV